MDKFAHILEAAVTGANCVESSKPEIPRQPPPSRPDSLLLSVKAKNISISGKKVPATTGFKKETAQAASQDSQGNKLLISDRGSALAQKDASRVAWETRLEKQCALPALASDNKNQVIGIGRKFSFQPH